MKPARLMRPTLPLLLPALSILLGCGGSPSRPETSGVPTEESAPPPPASEEADSASLPHRPPTMGERHAIIQLASAAERVRGLPFEREVPVEVRSEASITRELREDLDDEELIESQAIYTALGMLEEGLDLEALIISVLGEQVVGFYDPDGPRLVVRDDVMRRLDRGVGELDEARLVLIHELVHALQDQHLRLGERFEMDRDSDLETSFRSVVEGDATLAMIGYVTGLRGQPLSAITRSPAALAAMAAAPAPTRGEALRDAPAIVRVALVAPYVRGLSFTATLHGRGGWEAVNRAHRVLPSSTEQILHPERYFSGEPPEVVHLPEMPELEALGYRPLEDDTLGELELSVYLGQHLSSAENSRAADGWAGDRLRVYDHDEARPAVVWWTLWDDEGEAREASEAATAVAAGREGHRVLREGRAVLILRWVPEDAHAPLVATFRAFASGVGEPPAPSPPEGPVSPP